MEDTKPHHEQEPTGKPTGPWISHPGDRWAGQGPAGPVTRIHRRLDAHRVSRKLEALGTEGEYGRAEAWGDEAAGGAGGGGEALEC